MQEVRGQRSEVGGQGADFRRLVRGAAELAPASARSVIDALLGKRKTDADLSEVLGVPASWAAPVAGLWAELIAKLEDRSATDADIRDFLAEAADRVPELFFEMDVAALAAVIEGALGGAALEGLREALHKRGRRRVKGKAAAVAASFAIFAASAEASLPLVIQPLEEAVAKISDKTPVGSVLRTKEWARLPVALRERAFFSAAVESAKFLQAAQKGVQDILSLAREQTKGGEALIDRSVLIARLREVAQREGIPVDPAKAGGLQDITSRKRLGLIIDMNQQSAQGFANWKAGQDADLLDAFPAQEFVRLEGRANPRGGNPDENQIGQFWRNKWAGLGGKSFDGRMIALKTDPIWPALSRFGTPWMPFDFGSGMGLVDVDRAETEALGLLGRDEPVQPIQKDFNEKLQASVRGMNERQQGVLKKFFGEQIDIRDGVAEWRGSGVAKGKKIADIEISPNDSRTDLKDLRDTAQRSGEVFARNGFRDDGTAGGAELARAGRVFAAEVAAVRAGRKPAFHEELGGSSAPLARELREALPERIEVAERDGHLHVWDPKQARLTLDEIQALTLEGKNAGILGYGRARLNEPGTVVVIVETAAGHPLAGFHAFPDEAEKFGRQRAADYSDAMGIPVRVRILERTTQRSSLQGGAA